MFDKIRTVAAVVFAMVVSISFSSFGQAPGSPALSAPANAATNMPVSLTLSWNTVADASTYTVQVSTASDFSSTVISQNDLISTTLPITNLNCNTTYYWRVNATNTSGTGPWSNTWSFATILCAPGSPSLSSPASGSICQPTSLTLNWSTVSGATSYSVKVSTDNSFTSTIIYQPNITSTSLGIGALNNSTTYFWEVNATNGGGTSSYSSIFSFTTVGAAPGVPVLALPTNNTTNLPLSLTLSWVSGSGGTSASYTVQVSLTTDFTTTVFNNSGLTSTFSPISSLSCNTTYYWRVNAMNECGISSPWCSMWSFITAGTPLAPLLSTPTNGAMNISLCPSLAWNSVVGANSYSLQVATSALFATTMYNQTGITALTQPVCALNCNTTYYWRTNATNGCGPGPWSGVWSFTTMPCNLGAPLLLSPPDGSPCQPTSLTLCWNPVNGADSYTLEVDIPALSLTYLIQPGITATCWTLNNLPAGMTFSWQVNWTNAGGTSPWSSVWSFTTMNLPSAPVLSTPTNGAQLCQQPLTLDWGDVSSATTYDVQVSANSTFSTTVLSQNGLAASIASLGGLAGAATYFWHARGVNACGPGPWSTTWSFTITTPPPAPLLSTPTNGAACQPLCLTLIWGAVSGATAYTVQVSTITDFSTTVLSQSGIVTLTSPVCPLAPNTTYYWHVDAMNGCGPGPWSNFWSFTTAPSAPVAPALLTPANGSTCQQQPCLTLNWGAVTGGASYGLQISTASTFGTTVYSSTSIMTLTKQVCNLASNTTYYWHANATNGCQGTGSWSTVWSFTTGGTPAAPMLTSPANGATCQPVTGMTLKWGTAGGPDIKYNVQVSLTNSFLTTIYNFTNWPQNTHGLPLLVSFTRYYWRVRATNSCPLTGPWSTVWGFTTTMKAPIPTNLSSAHLPSPPLPANLKVGLRLKWQWPVGWNTLMGLIFYNVQVSKSSNFSQILQQQNVNWTLSQVLSATFYHLPLHTIFYCRVRAQNTCEDGFAPWVVFPGPIGPWVNSPPPWSDGDYQLNGDTTSYDSTGQQSPVYYRMQISAHQNFDTTIMDSIVSLPLQDSLAGLANGTYYWRLRGTGSGDPSAWTETWSFSVPTETEAVPTSYFDFDAGTGNNMTVLVRASANPAIGGVPLESGDEVGVFTPAGLCVGAARWDGVNNIPLMVYGDDPVSEEIDGMQVGESMQFRVWDSSLAREFPARVTYDQTFPPATADSLYQINGISVLSSLTVSLASQTIALNSRWNMSSFNIQPMDSSTTAVFGPGSGFLLVKNGVGTPYIPSYGITDLGFIHTGQGYQIYSSLPYTISVQGLAIDVATAPISLMASWNLIAYLPGVNMPPAEALSGIVSTILIAKNNVGQIYWPSEGISSIDSMRVGEGYYLYMLSESWLYYPSGMSKQIAGGRKMLRLPEVRHYKGELNTGHSATILAQKVMVAGSIAPDCSEIGAFDEHGNLVGAGSLIHGRAAFSVWGDDPQTKQKDGALVSEKITFKLWDGSQECLLDFIPANRSEACYSENGVLMGSFAVSSGALIKKFDLTRAYPNPFRRSVRIAYDVPALPGATEHAVEISVFDMKGSLVKHLVKGSLRAGHYEVTWALGRDEPGAAGSSVYIVRMKAAGFEKRMKIIGMR